MRTGSVAFLVALGGLSMLMPKQLARPRAAAAAARGAAADPQIQAMLEAEVTRRLEASGVEDAQALARASGQTAEVLRNPLIDQLSGAKPVALPSAPSLSLPSLPTDLSWRPSLDQEVLASTLSWAVPTALLVLCALLAIVDMRGAARALAGLCHWLCGAWLLLVAAGAPALRHLYRIDVWGALPGELWGAPAFFVLAAAGALRWVDMNAPVWNWTVAALAAPVASSLTGLLLK